MQLRKSAQGQHSHKVPSTCQLPSVLLSLLGQGRTSGIPALFPLCKVSVHSPSETGWKSRAFSGLNLEETASTYLKVLTRPIPGKQQVILQNKTTLFSSKDPRFSVLESCPCCLCKFELHLSLSPQTAEIIEDSKSTDS